MEMMMIGPLTGADGTRPRPTQMDFSFTPEEIAFRAELRDFLAEELPDWWRGMFVDDYHLSDVGAALEARTLYEEMSRNGDLP